MVHGENPPADAELGKAPLRVPAEIQKMEHELLELRKVLKQNPQLYKEFYIKDCVDAMKSTTMFSEMPDKYLMLMARKAERVELPVGHFIAREGVEVEGAVIISRGEVKRWAIINHRLQQVLTYCDRSVGTLHLYNVETVSRFNAECVTDVVAYRIKRSDLDEIIQQNPVVSQFIIRSLTKHIRHQGSKFITPFLEQRGHKTTFTTTTIAACFEAFFRSGMNSMINQKLAGGKAGPLFPQMHVQIPIRVVYLNGIKQVRGYVDQVDCHQHQFPTVTRMLLSFLPGVVMCPFSSVLEASNATNNPTHISRRWLIGIVPRLGREIIFGVGMNQLADFMTERISFIENDFIRHASGSISAGWIAGYFSHIPHNLSALKLMNPDLSYRQVWSKLYANSKPLVPDVIPKGTAAHDLCAQVMAVVMPIGVVRRSLQIAGTFLIVNGFTYYFRDRDWY